MKDNSPTIFISAGESSGDMHGAELVQSLKKIAPQLSFYGLGGEEMEKAGVKLFYNIVEIAVVGLLEVTTNILKFVKIFYSTVGKLKQDKPDLAILIDNPGLNLRLAKKIKNLNIPIIYYISPQVWAWGGKRIKRIKKLIDKILVVFKFEENFYRKENVNCKFVGHPLVEKVTPKMDPRIFKNKFKISKYYPIIGLLPGSREKEIKSHLPILLKGAKLIHKNHPKSAFIIIKSSGVKKDFYQPFITNLSIPIKLISDYNYDCINASDFCLVASGTATLETAILETPMIIVYKVSYLTWLILKPQVKVPYIGMVNVIAGEKIVPELVQHQLRPKKIANLTNYFLENPEKRNLLIKELKRVKDSLGMGEASEKASKEIINFIENNIGKKVR